MSGRDREVTGVISGARHVAGEALAAQARRAAFGFRSMGLQPGEAVALLLRNDIAFFTATLGAQLAEAYPVPINWHGKPDDVGYVLRDCRARVLVAHADLIAACRDVVPKDCRLLVVATPPEVAAAYGAPADACVPAPGDLNWDAWLAEQDELLEPPRSARGSVVYTSGTTGRPKGVVRAPAEGAARERMYGIVDEIFGVAREAPVRMVVTGPLYHPAPNFTGMRAAEPGSLAVLQPKFDELDLLAKIEQYGITHLNMVPTMFIRLLRLDEAVRRRFDVSSLQRVTHAAAPCPVEVKQAMIDWWGPVIWEFYGGTETGCVTLHNSEEALRKPGTVGRCLDNCEVKVLDDAGVELPPNAVGEIFARNRNLPDFTYLGQPERRAEAEVAGMITLGDVGYLDEDGYLFLCDRKRDMIISGGVNIYPAEIEQALVAMPGVKDCAVFGVPDPEFGEAVCAYVELLDGAALEAADITAWVRARLGGYKAPKVVRIAEALPREDSGKIMKKHLRAPYWADAGRRI
jgi:long-chain acyl-CoA synthetase